MTQMHNLIEVRYEQICQMIIELSPTPTHFLISNKILPKIKILQFVLQ